MDNSEEVGRICFEVNRAICEAAGDMSQKSWETAEQWQRDSIVRGVQFARANLNASLSDQHNAWIADRTADGWVFGSAKDTEAKTHPCLVPSDELPFEQRVKDYAFRAIVRAMT